MIELTTLNRTSVHSLSHVAMTVRDLQRSVAFFCEVLGFQRIASSEHATATTARLSLGDEIIELIASAHPQGEDYPADTRGHDHWFQHLAIVVRDINTAYARLRRHGVRHVSPAPQTLPPWNDKAAGIRAFYFRGPEGHFLELIQYPSGKGQPRWHRPTARLFLGIDHTAIVVADTQASVAFYCNQLGLEVAGESENFGPEQEQLSGVAGARVRITTLRAAEGLGIELLEYISPTDGRRRPRRARPSDLLHWQTVLNVDHARQLSTCDPDGHRLVLRPVNSYESQE